MKFSPAEIQAQIETAAAARSAASIGAENAWDYIEHGGVRFYRPNVAHVWFIMQVLREKTQIIKHWPIVLMYILAHDQEATRNKLFKIAEKGNVVEAAYQFMVDQNLLPQGVTEAHWQLAADLDTKKKMRDLESSLSGGPV
jgi:hypothetical protein